MKKISKLIVMFLVMAMIALPSVVKADRPVEIYRTTQTVPGGTISVLVEGIEVATGKSFFVTYDANSLEYIPNNNPSYTITAEKGKITISIPTQVVGEGPRYPHLEFKVLKDTVGKVTLTLDSTDEFLKNSLWGGTTVEVDIVQNTVVKEAAKVDPNKDIAPNPSDKADEKTDDKQTTPEEKDETTGTGENDAKDDKDSVLDKTEEKETKNNDLLLYISFGVIVLLVIGLVFVIVKNKKTNKEA